MFLNEQPPATHLQTPDALAARLADDPALVDAWRATHASVHGTQSKSGPLEAHEFSQLMTALPDMGASVSHLAVAVSGGADSLCLCVLLHAWAQARNIACTAISVDHGLRASSRAELAQVADWLAARGIAHRILHWQGDKPACGIQHAARIARYDLMSHWARNAGVRHLFLAHHLDDQAETFLMRLLRNSGVDGLSAMASVREHDGVRLMRPLLRVAKSRLCDTLRQMGQDWIEDPSNQNPAFSRVRLRQLAPDLQRLGFGAERLAGAADYFARLRATTDREVAAVLAQHVEMHTAGFAHMARAMLDVPSPLVMRAVARLVLAVGGGRYAPAHDKMRQALDYMRQGWSFTLGGCRFDVGASKAVYWVSRECRGAGAQTLIPSSGVYQWDRRFEITVSLPDTCVGGGPVEATYWLARLDAHGWNAVVGARPDLKGCDIPHPARLSLPALMDEAGVVAVPHLGYVRKPISAKHAQKMPYIEDIRLLRADFRRNPAIFLA